MFCISVDEGYLRLGAVQIGISTEDAPCGTPQVRDNGSVYNVGGGALYPQEDFLESVAATPL